MRILKREKAVPKKFPPIAIFSVFSLLLQAVFLPIAYALPPACEGIEDQQALGICIERQYLNAGISVLESGNCVPEGSSPRPASESGSAPAAPTELREKLAMLIFARANNTAEIGSATSQKIGGVFVRPADKNDKATYESIKSSLNGTTPLIAVDFEGGRVQAPGEGIVGKLDSAQLQAAMSDDELKQLAKEKGQQLAQLGINMDFAPVVDIGGTNQAVIGDRAFSNDTNVVTAKAAAFASGMSEAGIISTLKHFPGHGSRDGDSHTSPVATAPLTELESRDIKPYQTLSKNAKTAIMMGHLKVPEWGEQATSLNSKAYEYLRLVLGFNGVVVTDALDMLGMSTTADQPTRAVESIKAGADMALLSSVNEISPTLDKLEAAVNNNQLSTTKVDEAVKRVLTLRGSAPLAPASQPVQNNCGQCSAVGTVPLDGENPGRAFQFFVSQGMAPNQAAGFVGNLMMESGPSVSPTIVNPKSGAYGIAQWLGSRLTGLKDYAKQAGGDYTTFEVQIQYLWEVDLPAQIRGGYPDIEFVTKNDPNMSLEEATRIIMEEFERPSAAEKASSIDRRISYAQSVLNEHSGSASAATSSGGDCGGTAGTVVGDLAWPVPVSFWQSNQEWFTKPHHDYPASDIPVPSNTAVYSISSGEVIALTKPAGDCGTGLIIKTGSAEFLYCHGTPNTITVSAGQAVSAGQEIFKSDNTGHSTGPHLHVGLKINGTPRCPQSMFSQMGQNKTSIDLASLPTSGCSY